MYCMTCKSTACTVDQIRGSRKVYSIGCGFSRRYSNILSATLWTLMTTFPPKLGLIRTYLAIMHCHEIAQQKTGNSIVAAITLILPLLPYYPLPLYYPITLYPSYYPSWEIVAQSLSSNHIAFALRFCTKI